MTTWRWIGRVAAVTAFVGLPLLVAAVRLTEFGRGELVGRQQPLPAADSAGAAPPYDPTKPTVAIILGADLTEITDALGPYEMFSRAGAFNVYTVAPERRPTLLSGGLRILPHHSLAELEARLGGAPPAIVVVPNIPNIAKVENKPLVEWMKRQAAAGSVMHSWCTGAMALAEAGLLDGLTATAHWGDLSRLAKLYPRVEWVRGVRWVDHGQVITSAGLTSGIDASLRVLSRFAGEDVARRVARELHYPNFHFSVDPVVTPYTVGPADAILPANLAFRVPRQQIGLALYDGVGEMDLTGLYDAHIASADLRSIAATSGGVRSAHGLILLPSLVASDSENAGSIGALRRLDRFVVPGRNGPQDGARVVGALRSLAPALPPTYVHVEAAQRFGLEPVIEDLGRTIDLPTARFALKRLEFRSETIRLEGNAIAWGTLPVALGLGVLGAFVALALGRLFRSGRMTPRLASILFCCGLVIACSGCDLAYVMRVVTHGDSHTDDHFWKRTARLAPAATPAAWRESQGCDAVAAAFDAEPDAPSLPRYLSQGGALGFVVVHDGAIACEWYGNGGARARPAAAFSISKTVTSLLLARAVADGKVGSLSDPITTYVPTLAARDRRFAAITLAELVDMRSGIAFADALSFPWVTCDPPEVYYATDLARTAVERTRIEGPPGRFVYNDYAPNLIGLALENGYSVRSTVGPMQALWSELGAESAAAWTVDEHGFAWHESGLVATARDLARIGQLMLDDGQVGGRQVAPRAFLARSIEPAGHAKATTFAGVELGYRNGWWLPGDDDLLAMGAHGQVMLVSRASRTVIVRLGSDGHQGSRGLGFDGRGETNISIARRFQRASARLRRGLATP